MSEDTKQMKKPWQTGENLPLLQTAHFVTKEPRQYIFKELNQEYGSRLFHRYVVIIIKQWDKCKTFIKTFLEKVESAKQNDGVSVGQLIDEFGSMGGLVSELLTSVFTWETIEEMAMYLLADHVMIDDDGEHVADSKGYTNIKGDPFELYNALFFAICQNWPKYVLPLFGAALEDLTRDSGPEQN
jgi:hypothetical protein